MLVGADGYQSIVREVVLEDEDMVKPGGLTLYTGVVDAEEMLKDPELRPYALSDEVSAPVLSIPRCSVRHAQRGRHMQWAIWMGSHRSLCGTWRT